MKFAAQQVLALAGLVLIATAGMYFHKSQTPASLQAVLPDSNPTNYDSYALAIEWSGTVCKSRKCLPNAPSQPNFFNIHGLWPNVFSNTAASPSDCSSIPLNFAAMTQDLQQSLNLRWNGLYNDLNSFLTHEWSKHGTCWTPALEKNTMAAVPTDIKPLIDQGLLDYNSGNMGASDFMKVGLALANKYNLFNAFTKIGIVPSATAVYDQTKIAEAVKQSFGVENYELICTKSPTSGRSQIAEFRLCLSLSYNPIDCPKKVTSSCQASVEFPLAN